MTIVDVEFRDDAAGITSSMLGGGFFEGWPNPPSPETHLEILRGSLHVALAVERDTAQVVGFANLVGDGVLAAYLPLLEVLPRHRSRGIATRLVHMLLHAARDCYMLDVACDDELVPFYERFGMRRSNAMMLRNYDRQAGVVR